MKRLKIADTSTPSNSEPMDAGVESEKASKVENPVNKDLAVEELSEVESEVADEVAVAATAQVAVDQVEAMMETRAVVVSAPATPAVIITEEAETGSPLRGEHWESLAQLIKAGYYE